MQGGGRRSLACAPGARSLAPLVRVRECGLSIHCISPLGPEIQLFHFSRQFIIAYANELGSKLISVIKIATLMSSSPYSEHEVIDGTFISKY
jgi:hypothetical protein